MESTHRIYLFQDRQGRWIQTSEPTGIFYDINANQLKDAFGTSWYRITGAAVFSQARKVLYQDVPDGAEEGIVRSAPG